MVMRDFKYRKLIGGGPIWDSQMKALASMKSKKLRRIAQAFIDNISRTGTAAVAPALIAYGARVEQLLADCAVFQATGSLESDLDKLPNTFKSNNKCRQEFKRLAKAFSSNNSPEKRSRRINQYGIQHINFLLQKNPAMQSTMDALFASVVVESWTAFETLAADVWYAALDFGPNQWIKRTEQNSHRFKSGNSKLSDSELSKSPNPQRKYGSFLRALDKVSLQRLQTIKDWYGITFGKQITSQLFAADSYITALSSVRNVLTHKSGVADRKYLDAVKPFPELNAAHNKPIRLDGEIVNRLRTAAIIVGKEILAFVDNQLTHRAKS